MPVCKLYDMGQLNEFKTELVRTNVCAPDEVISDLMANVSATAVGERMLGDFLVEYGPYDFTALSAEIRCRSETAMRSRIAEMTPGTYRNRIQVEGRDAAIDLAVALEVRADGSIHVDFAGTGASISLSD